MIRRPPTNERTGFLTVSFGCKLNQFDGAGIEGELARRGLDAVSDPARAAFVVVNTCTVTSKADADARKWIRGVKRANPDCVLLVTGCYAERDRRALAAMDEVDHVFGNADKSRIASILTSAGVPDGGAAPISDRGCDGAPIEMPNAVRFGDRSRAFLKVQDGCNLVCSYCIIPTVRGRSRSLPADTVARAHEELADAGYREVVLTGVNTGDWGTDLEPRARLVDLLDTLLATRARTRVRLNSLEPRTVTDEVVARLADSPRLASHVQVPLQSGSDRILRRMRRNYRARTYLERVETLARAVPDVGIGADVIVGFPGETDRCFEETLRVVRDSPLTYLHVFAWSPRPGTPAAALDGRPSGDVVRERSARLRALAARKGTDFRRGFVGKEVDAVVLGAHRNRAVERALAGPFFEVDLPRSGAGRGDLVRVRIEGVDVRPDDAGTTDAVVTGRVIGRPDWLDPTATGGPIEREATVRIR